MKATLQTVLSVSILLGSSISASASNVARECYWNASKFVAAQAERRYDEDGFNAYECFVAPNKKAVICDVSASKGDGAAMDTYRVVMNLSCSKAYRVEMTGEE